jgi:hypothetical protein
MPMRQFWLFPVPILISKAHANAEILNLRKSPVNPISGLQGKFTLLGYLETSCNCSWALLALLGAILGIQFGRFPAVSRSPLLQIWCRERTRQSSLANPKCNFSMQQ